MPSRLGCQADSDAKPTPGVFKLAGLWHPCGAAPSRLLAGAGWADSDSMGGRPPASRRPSRYPAGSAVTPQ
jgi:hypothetical protein